MVPGGADIAMATSELMKEYDAAVWAHHGLFCSGPDFDITFGLMHTIEKAAEIYVKAMSMGQGIKQTDFRRQPAGHRQGIRRNPAGGIPGLSSKGRLRVFPWPPFAACRNGR